MSETKTTARHRTYTVVNEPQIVHAGHTVKGSCSCDSQVLATSQFVPPSSIPELNFHKMFYECDECKKRPAARLCTTCWKGMCLKHSESHPHHLFISYDLSAFATMIYCTKCRGHAMCEPIEPVLEQLFTTKGAFVDDPIRDKDISSLENDKYSVTACTMQGWRASNEDAYCVHLNLNKMGVMVFGVFDGHGGDRVAQFVATNFGSTMTSILKVEPNIAEALKKSFIAVDEAIQECDDLEEFRGSSGATACVVAIDATNIYCANAGDARGVLCRGGALVPLSTDHKPSVPSEKARIEASGSRVSPDGRVDDVLAVSRALGDLDFKQAAQLPPDAQAVTCVPDVTITPRDGADEFIVVACDGVWDCKSSVEVIQYLSTVKDNMKEGVAGLLDACLAPSLEESGIGTDNMSIICTILKK